MEETQFSIEIPDYKLLSARGDKATIHYRIVCKFGTKSWEVTRRYKSFLKLHQHLKTSHHLIPNLPSRTVFKVKSVESLSIRRQKLLVYLTQLVMMPEVFASQELQSFLGIQDQRISLKKNGLAQLGNISNKKHGYRDAIAAPEKKLLFLIQSDTSVLSR